MLWDAQTRPSAGTTVCKMRRSRGGEAAVRSGFSHLAAVLRNTLSLAGTICKTGLPSLELSSQGQFKDRDAT